ncbi:MAG: hypothetical protein ACTSYT_01010 [Candidatus Asgardarchaeia archaeon]
MVRDRMRKMVIFLTLIMASSLICSENFKDVYLDECRESFTPSCSIHSRGENLSITLNVTTRLYQSQRLKIDFIIERYDSQDHTLFYSIHQDDKIAIEGSFLVNMDNVSYEVETDKLWKMGSFHLKVKVYEGNSLILNETIPFDVLKVVNTTLLYAPYEVEQEESFNISILIKTGMEIKNLRIYPSEGFLGEFFVSKVDAGEGMLCNITLRHSSPIPYDFGERELILYITLDGNILDTIPIELRIKLSILNILLGFFIPSVEFFAIIFYVMFSRYKMDELYLKDLEKMGEIPGNLRIIEFEETYEESLMRRIKSLGFSQKKGPVLVFEGKGLYIALLKKGGKITLYLYFSDEDSMKSFIDQTVGRLI